MSKYKDKGFTVLGFPCNQFGLQENCKNEELLNAMKYVRPGNGFAPDFPMFRKIEVNGPNTHPLYQFLKSALPETPATASNWVSNQSPNMLTVTPCQPGEVQWNFEKFLCNREGKPVKRFAPKAPMEEVQTSLEALLD